MYIIILTNYSHIQIKEITLSLPNIADTSFGGIFSYTRSLDFLLRHSTHQSGYSERNVINVQYIASEHRNNSETVDNNILEKLYHNVCQSLSSFIVPIWNLT